MVIYYIEHVYLRPYVYSFCQIFQALRLFPALRLFRRGYQFSKTQIWCQKILDQINKQKKSPASGKENVKMNQVQNYFQPIV